MNGEDGMRLNGDDEDLLAGLACGAIWASYCDHLHGWGHECSRNVDHDGRHECACGSSWSEQ